MEGDFAQVNNSFTLQKPKFVENVNVSRQCELLVLWDASMKACTTGIHLHTYVRIEIEYLLC